MSPAGIAREEAALQTARAKDLATLHAEFAGRLEAVRVSLERRLHALRGQDVSAEDIAAAHAMADRLRRLSVDRGVEELCEWFDQVGAGERPREQMVMLLPILRSGYETPGLWAGRVELSGDPKTKSPGLIPIGESLIDGSWQGDVTAQRLQRATRLGGELDVFFFLAESGDRSALNATVTQGFDADGHREPRTFALFPDQPPPTGPALEDKQAHYDSVRDAWEKELQDSRDAIAQSQEP